jgi:hypothetical protein
LKPPTEIRVSFPPFVGQEHNHATARPLGKLNPGIKRLSRGVCAIDEHRNELPRLDLARSRRTRGRAELPCRRQDTPGSADQQKVDVSRFGKRSAQPPAVFAERPR